MTATKLSEELAVRLANEPFECCKYLDRIEGVGPDLHRVAIAIRPLPETFEYWGL
jgi:hypothetical protein